ncbi:hypothetical protein [Nocardioides sp.]|uniref:hypothetical protein n=1 Tax=Nocardioides sp. TaxID=35761 RepID=UPI0019BB006A|nr:hypothetical protein [Nocardioides sp.]MBC7278894.1 hypothetical protein [Nocardioides sp.]
MIADVGRWLTAHDGYPGRTGQPLAYVVQGTRGGEVEGWIGGTTPPQTTMPPIGDAAPWPADPGAPSCRMTDLEVTFGGHDAASPSRSGSVRRGRRAISTSSTGPRCGSVPGRRARPPDVRDEEVRPGAVADVRHGSGPPSSGGGQRITVVAAERRDLV